MSNGFDPDDLKRAIVSPRWSALTRVDLSVAELERWDQRLLRESRVITPIDVQALYVPPGDTTRFVRLPFALTTPDGAPPAATPEPFAAGETRAAGVHLHWAPPDALLNGTIQQLADGARNRLGLPPLPDRWVVLRLFVPKGADQPRIRGWVLEADTAKAIPLEAWPAGSETATPSGKTVLREELTGTVGGSLNWAGVYDAVTNRLAFHDPLDDVRAAAPDGVVDDLCSYVIAGWWSDPKLDPLDGAQTTASLHDRLKQLGWRLVDDAEGGDQIDTRRTLDAARRDSIGLKSRHRYSLDTPPASAQTRAATPSLQAFVDPKKAFHPVSAQFVDGAEHVIATEPRWPRSTLLHGVIHGVPLAGPVVADQRPAATNLDVVLGHHVDDLAAALASAGIEAAADRRATERVLAAFSGQLLANLGTPDGVIDAEEHEHVAGFASRPGGQGPLERFRMGAQAGPLAAGRAARSEQARLKAEHKGKASSIPDVRIEWAGTQRVDLYKATEFEPRRQVEQWDGGRPVSEPIAEVREVRQPAPRFHLPIDPVIAVRGPHRSLRHRGDGRFSPDGLLQCRWPSQIAERVQGVADGFELVNALPSGALPEEVLRLARNAIVQDPFLAPWLAEAAARRDGLDAGSTHRRFMAEAAMRFGRDGIYDGATPTFGGEKSSRLTRTQIGDQLRRFSLVEGVDADPVGVTVWSQPWVPLWLEWEVGIEAADRFDDWRLGAIDLEPPATLPPASPRTFAGRSALDAGVARTLAAAIEEWLRGEEQRDHDNVGEVDDATADALERIADAIGDLDVVTATVDGLHERLLGLAFDALGLLRTRKADGGIALPVPIAPPQLVVAGALRLMRARLVDAFGRTLDVPLDKLRVPARDELSGPTPALRWRPRLLRPARWLFRFVEPLPTSTTGGTGGEAGPREAMVDQIDPARMVNPVAGFLLPDHIDEALEVFDTAGQPLGQLMHEPFGGGVVWEIAPGRSGPADAGPLHELPAANQLLGHLAAGIVASDAAARNGAVANPEAESALSAFLRAIDTTLWTVDTFAQLGTEHIAGLVGRPIAVVRATLKLDIDDDFDELDLSDPARREEREAAYRALADRAFPVRLGELARSDDGVLAFFVDDDYTHVHVVDKVVRDAALDAGKGRGQLAQLGTAQQVPDVKPILHPYVVADDEIVVHPGQVLRFTLLMHPAGQVHLTSGVLPRKALALARDWVQPGLAVIAPSVRVGPVLVDADQVRLPKVSSFPKEQVWTRRTTPFTWKDDPILAATQTALLPDTPAEAQEGYIRIAPKPNDSESGS